ncbi:MAG: monovalent cation/H+ antiporter complex subunit F [Spirochaetales bacterium]
MSFLEISLVVLAGLALGGLIRILFGPTVWDRLLGMSLISSKIIVAIVIVAVILERSFLMDIAIIYSLLGFISSVLIARFIEKKGGA